MCITWLLSARSSRSSSARLQSAHTAGLPPLRASSGAHAARTRASSDRVGSTGRGAAGRSNCCSSWRMRGRIGAPRPAPFGFAGSPRFVCRASRPSNESVRWAQASSREQATPLSWIRMWSLFWLSEYLSHCFFVFLNPISWSWQTYMLHFNLIRSWISSIQWTYYIKAYINYEGKTNEFIVEKIQNTGSTGHL